MNQLRIDERERSTFYYFNIIISLFYVVSKFKGAKYQLRRSFKRSFYPLGGLHGFSSLSQACGIWKIFKRCEGRHRPNGFSPRALIT